jgi:hypothetical protein
MHTYVHLLWPFPLITRIAADICRLRQTTVGRRCDQKTLPQRFLAQSDGLHGVRRVLRSQHSFPAALSLIISACHAVALAKEGL